MLGGYHGRLLEVDLTRQKTRVVELDEDVLRKYVGGRGLAVHLLYKELGDRWEQVDPLGPENPLLILAGPLTGFYPGIKVTISGKSPQSNGVVGSVVSSEIGLELRAAGYDGMVVRGASKDPVYILVDGDRVEIRGADEMWGLRATELISYINRKIYPELLKKSMAKGVPKEPAYIYIGPAGEARARTAAVMAKLAHAAGYGGYGAVMGAKRLKAVIVKGYGPLPRPAEPEKMQELMGKIWEKLIARHSFRQWGTAAGGYSTGYVSSSEPIRNWQEEWHDRRELGVQSIETLWAKRFWGDYGCPTTCMKISVVRRGPYKGSVTDAPDYELIAYVGTNLGIFDPEKIVYMSSLVDELGFDAINTGNLLGFVAELYEKGLLDSEMLGGVEPRWGDPDSFAKLLELIVERRGIGEVLAEGTYRAALRLSQTLGQDVTRYAVHVKGVAVGAHGVRSKLDYPQPHAYAASVQGGDHTSVATLPPDRDWGELWMVFADSAVICAFNAVDFDTMLAYYNAVTGAGLTRDEWFNQHSRRILALQRILLLLGGPDVYWDPRIHDDNPARFYEPLPSGPRKGMAASKGEVSEMLRKYYAELGWDEQGVPTREELERLGIGEAYRLVEKIRNRLGEK